MRVQIFEPFTGGHYTQYIAYLLPTLTRMLDQGYIERIIVTTSRGHCESPYFTDLLSPFAAKVEFDTSAPTIINYRWNSGTSASAALIESVRRHRPDYVISTSADHGALMLALRCLYGSEFAKRGIMSVGILHSGFTGAVSLRHRIRDIVHRFARRFSPWSELQIVNPLLYETIRRQGSVPASRLKLVPHPVEVRDPLDKLTARRLLQIPVEGRYIGHVGKTDGRKAIPELLAAFSAAHISTHDRFLLAGSLYAPYRELIEREYRDLLTEDRLILIDRYLTPEEVHIANCASDVVAMTYYPMESLSANLLTAVAARRPVIANAYGYTGMIIKTFGVGWSCDILDPDSLAHTIERSLNESDIYSLDNADRLIEFHRPQNYADTVLRQLYERLGLPVTRQITWDWVTARADG